jgi:outer membrane protein OmpA-like peptidoglycan-associated protein
VMKGDLDESRVEAYGYGSTIPIIEEKTDADRKINRRVEFEIFRPK